MNVMRILCQWLEINNWDICHDQYYIHSRTTGLCTEVDGGPIEYSRTPDERPPSPTTIPLIRPHFV